MEQTISQPKSSTTARKVFMVVGILLLLGLVGVMAVNLRNVESTDLQGRVATDFTLPLFDQFEEESITLSDLRGQVVRVIVDGIMTAGRHAVSWNGCDAAGQAVASGTYFCRLTTDAGRSTRKMQLVR